MTTILSHSNNIDTHIYNNQYHLFHLIKNTLISIDAIILHHVKIYNTGQIMYSLINLNKTFNINNLINLISSILYDDINLIIHKNYNNYYIFEFQSNNNILLSLHLFTMNLVSYVYSIIDTYFDINTIISNYYGYSIMPNYHNNIIMNYDDIIYRVQHKRFCYLSNDMNTFYKLFEDDNYKLVLPLSNIINKIIYALKLIQNNWLMDEYILNDDAWTINYFNTYKNHLNLIKFKNVQMIIENCDICNEKINLNDITFNCKNYFIHYNCLFSKLYEN